MRKTQEKWVLLSPEFLPGLPQLSTSTSLRVTPPLGPEPCVGPSSPGPRARSGEPAMQSKHMGVLLLWSCLSATTTPTTTSTRSTKAWTSAASPVTDRYCHLPPGPLCPPLPPPPPMADCAKCLQLPHAHRRLALRGAECFRSLASGLLEPQFCHLQNGASGHSHLTAGLLTLGKADICCKGSRAAASLASAHGTPTAQTSLRPPRCDNQTKMSLDTAKFASGQNHRLTELP